MKRPSNTSSTGKRDFRANHGIEIRVLGSYAAQMSRPRILSTSIRASAAFRRVQQRSSPLFRIDSNSRAPLESFPGVAWPRCLANLRQCPARLRSNARLRHAEWPSIFNASSKFFSRIVGKGFVRSRFESNISRPTLQFLHPRLCTNASSRGKDRDIQRTTSRDSRRIAAVFLASSPPPPSFHHDRLHSFPSAGVHRSVESRREKGPR